MKNGNNNEQEKSIQLLPVHALPHPKPKGNVTYTGNKGII